jgi:hypothetical protein
LPAFRWSKLKCNSFQNVYPILAAADNKALRFLSIGIVVLHAAMAMAMKVLFFSYAVGGATISPDPTSSSGDGSVRTR